MNKKILVVGSGAREHAIVWKLAQSSEVSKIWVAPGNPGIGLEPKTDNIAIQATDIPALLAFAKENTIDLTIIGAELPLSLGIVDAFQTENLACLGPTKVAAQLETSKAFAKEFMQRHNIPTAKYAEFNDIQKAYAYLENQTFPQVIKADGLAAGKGVIIVNNLEEAKNAVNILLTDNKIIIEEFLEGFEVSFIVLSDGINIIPLATAQDNKRRNNHHTGPNTGGMGACSPAPHMNENLEKQILETIIQPTLNKMHEENCTFQGFLFAGLMITPAGEPKVLEFNCRLGDPETQAILMRLQSDFFTLCFQAAHQSLDQIKKIIWNHYPSMSLVIATQQYPENSVHNEPISGIPELKDLPENIHIFHAGTSFQDNQLVARGGRILSIGVIDENFETIRQKAYAIAEKIHWESGIHYRDDIGIFI